MFDIILHGNHGGMIQNLGRAEMDEGKGEYALGMKGNGLERGERILGMILTRGKTHGEGVQKGKKQWATG